MDNKGFFDANPKMLFLFGLITGIALTLIISSAFPNATSGLVNPDEDPSQGQQDAPGQQDPAVLAPVTQDDHVFGDLEKAKVVIVEYSDIQCNYCSRLHPTLKAVMDKYGDDVAWVYRHFPLSFHAEAIPSALASECAAAQGQFWPYTDMLYERQNELGDALYIKLAQDLGLNMSEFEECYENEEYLEAVQEDFTSGTAAGVTGTPGSFVNGMAVTGAQPQSVFESLIDQMLAQ